MKEFLRCRDCKHDKGKCVGASRRGGHKNCFEKKTMSNADRIRAMSDEELAGILALLTKHDLCLNPSATSCDDCLLHSFCSGCTEGDELYWLQQPAEEVQGDGE